MARKRVLVADDDASLTFAWKNALDPKEYEVITVSNGKAALDQLSRKRFDIALLDIQMEKITGIDVAQIILDKYPETRIMIISGYEEEYRKQLERLGIDAVFGKPFKMQEIIRQMEEILFAEDKVGKPLDKAWQDLHKKQKVQRPKKGLIAKAKILFIEKPTPACMLKDYFTQDKKEQFKVEIAWTKKDAMKKVKRFKPDIVVVNVHTYPGASALTGDIFRPEFSFAPKDVIPYTEIKTFEEAEKGQGKALLRKIKDRVYETVFKHGMFKR